MGTPPWVRTLGSALGVLALAGASLAAAPAAGAATVSQSFTSPGESSFTVPQGICGVSVSVTGAAGGAGGLQGGFGAGVQGHLSVQPGDVLGIVVGGQGGAGSSSATPYSGGTGGFGGGGGGGVLGGGGGGGASVVHAGGTPLLVAGGGGGGTIKGGGAGGNAGVPGQDAAAGGTTGSRPIAGGGTSTGDGGAGVANTSGIPTTSSGGGGGLATGGASLYGGSGGNGDGAYGGGGGASSATGDVHPGADAGPGQSGLPGAGATSIIGPGGGGGAGTTGGGNGGSSSTAGFNQAAGGGGGGIGFGGGGGGTSGGGGGGGYGAGGGGLGGGGGGSSYVAPATTRVSSRLASAGGDGRVVVQYDPDADSCTTVLPGSGIVAAPTSATSPADLAVSVTLDTPNSATVTVDWSTLFVPGLAPNPFLGPEAPASDYTASSGTVTFTPGQTTATIHIPVLADSNPTSPDEFLIVSFHSPTNAHMGGFWGLGFGVITPSPPG